MIASPVLYRTFCILTPPSELPRLPEGIGSYLPIHLYTGLQIAVTVAIFIITLTKAGPVFPIIILALVPFRLRVMNRIWTKETLCYVDAWACRGDTLRGGEMQRALPVAETGSTERGSSMEMTGMNQQVPQEEQLRRTKRA